MQLDVLMIAGSDLEIHLAVFKIVSYVSAIIK
ncbi:hypothetical protein SAMN05443246_2004 [Paenibacillus sp. GP183]|nr:hypothetical protein SAMN05443246_2004 [Paenibacillus sp. GP183]